MPSFRVLFAVPLLAAFLASPLACSSSDSGSTSASPCQEASKVATECNNKPQDGGKVTYNFDAAKCEQAGEQGRKAAQCIVDNRNNCDCMLKCSLGGTC